MADVRSNPDTLDLTSADVIDLDAPEVVDAGPPTRPPWRAGLVALLVLALVASLAGGVWLYRDRTAYQSEPAWVAVTAYVDAVNAGDVDQLRMALTDDAVWTGYDPKGAVVMTYTGEDYLLFQEQFFPGFAIEVLGPPVVYGDDVAVPLHMTGRLGVNYDAITTFSVRTVGGVPMVEAIMAIPTTAE